MILVEYLWEGIPKDLSRVCGDDPQAVKKTLTIPKFVPRMRG